MSYMISGCQLLKIWIYRNTQKAILEETATRPSCNRWGLLWQETADWVRTDQLGCWFKYRRNSRLWLNRKNYSLDSFDIIHMQNKCAWIINFIPCKSITLIIIHKKISPEPKCSRLLHFVPEIILYKDELEKRLPRQ